MDHTEAIIFGQKQKPKLGTLRYAFISLMNDFDCHPANLSYLHPSITITYHNIFKATNICA